MAANKAVRQEVTKLEGVHAVYARVCDLAHVIFALLLFDQQLL